MLKKFPLLAAAGAAVVAMMAFGPASASAKTTTCHTRSPNVIGERVFATLSSHNVDPRQRQFATCRHAKKVIKSVTARRLEEATPVRGFFVKPTVLAVNPDKVRYRCTFKGADTPTFVKIAFRVTYNQD